MDFYAKAKGLDYEDVLKDYRNLFHIPQFESGREWVYFCGHSLGLQPKNIRPHINHELDVWAEKGVKGHFEGDTPWYSYHKHLLSGLAMLTGAKESEVCPMNSLTVNLHLAFTSFYKPGKKRFKILCEDNIFPSDKFAIESQVRLHGYDPDNAIVYVADEKGQSDPVQRIVETIEAYKDELACVFIGTVNFLTGAYVNPQPITEKCHEHGIIAGFDLAHAIGNISLKLHEWKVDFAVWCSYKYLNAGPGAVGGLYVYEKHAQNLSLPRLAGWWGQEEQSRFSIYEKFYPLKSAEGWQLSNAPVLSMAAQRASLQLFEEVGMDKLIAKNKAMQNFINELYTHFFKDAETFVMISPFDTEYRGAQVSFSVPGAGKAFLHYLDQHGIVADWREPDILRIAPVPFYNTFEEIHRFFAVVIAYFND